MKAFYFLYITFSSLITNVYPSLIVSTTGTVGIEVRSNASKLSNEGRSFDLINYLLSVEKAYGSLKFDDDVPSLYNYLACALYQLHRLEEAIHYAKLSVELDPQDERALINLGEIQVQSFHLEDAAKSFEKAFENGDFFAVARALRTNGWSARWNKHELYTSDLEMFAKLCELGKPCYLDSSSGLEYTDAPGRIHALIQAKMPNCVVNFPLISESAKPPFWIDNLGNWLVPKTKKLKIGFVSSDFGVHPVSSLVRGLFQHFDKSRFEIVALSVQSKSSWWGVNISKSVDYFYQLSNFNMRDAAEFVAQQKIEILIDLNGHTMFTGLPIMSYKPSRLQMSFLGLPTSTSASFIDYYIGDYVAIPPEIRDHYSEKLLLMPPCYIVNDYSQVLGDIPTISYENRASRQSLLADVDLDKATILFATLSNSQKMDPAIFQVWMNIMRRFAGSKMLVMKYRGWESFMPNLRNASRAFGISIDRLAFAEQAGWIDHITAKTAIDLILDTSTKTGHTSGLDGLWAGVPTISVGMMTNVPARAGESMAAALGSELGIAYSLKDYEDIAFSLLKTKYKRNVSPQQQQDKSAHPSEKEHHPDYLDPDGLLRIWRNDLAKKRVNSPLFDTVAWTRTFERFMEASWEIANIMHQKNSEELLHIFSRNRAPLKIGKGSSEHGESGENWREVPLSHHFDSSVVEGTKREKEAQKRAKEGKATPSLPVPPRDLPETYEPRDKGKYPPIPDYVFDGREILLNIGGINHVDGWLQVNSFEASYQFAGKVDIQREMFDLHGLADNSVAVVYCSHTLEHVPFGDDTHVKAIREWFRVIKPGGLLFLSVPDLDTLAHMYLDPSFGLSEKWHVTKILYGAQYHRGDVHYNAFSEESLTALLREAGFCQIQRHGRFRLGFGDTSSIEYKKYFVSLNIAARVCPSSKPSVEYEGFNIDYDAEPYQGMKVSSWSTWTD